MTAALAALAFSLSTVSPARPEVSGRFTLGSVDLVALATTLPPAAASALPQPAPPATLRDLHARVEAFLVGDLKREVEKARWRVAWARRSAAVDPGTSSYESNWVGALLAVAVGSIFYATDSSLRDAKACLSLLEGDERRVRALRDDVPETDEPVTPDLIARWERLSGELRENVSCRGRRSP